MLFRSIPDKLESAKASLRRLAEKAQWHRDRCNEAALYFTSEAMRHDDVAFEIEQMLGPETEVDFIPDNPIHTDQESS